MVELLKRPEGKILEFKRDLSSPDGALRTLVAFANTSGGTLLIGVEDGTRHVRGVREPLDLEERLASLRIRDSCRFGLTIEDLPRGISKLRNRVIGRVLHTLGLIEQWGSGIQRMTAACQEAGPAAPKLEEIGTRFRVTFLTERVSSLLVDDTDRAILDLLVGDEGRLTHEIATGIGLTSRATRTRLIRLIGRGLIREVGTSAKDPKRRYFRAT